MYCDCCCVGGLYGVARIDDDSSSDVKVFFSSWKRSYVRPRVNPRQQRHDRRATWYGGTTIPISNEALLQAMEWNGMVVPYHHTYNLYKMKVTNQIEIFTTSLALPLSHSQSNSSS